MLTSLTPTHTIKAVASLMSCMYNNFSVNTISHNNTLSVMDTHTYANNVPTERPTQINHNNTSQQICLMIKESTWPVHNCKATQMLQQYLYYLLRLQDKNESTAGADASVEASYNVASKKKPGDRSSDS